MECSVYSFENICDPWTQSPWHWIQLRMQRHFDWAHSFCCGRTVQSLGHSEAHTKATADAHSRLVEEGIIKTIFLGGHGSVLQVNDVFRIASSTLRDKRKGVTPGMT